MESHLYTSESPLREPKRFLREFLRDLMSSRELAWQLFFRNFRAQYRTSKLGYAWAILPMLATTGVWALLQSSNVVDFGTPGVNYVLYVATGMFLWQTFVDAVHAPARMVVANKNMLIKINFPREALFLAAVADAAVNTLLRFVVLLVCFAVYLTLPAPTTVLIPIGCLSLLVLGSLIGAVVVPFGLLYDDFSRALMLVTQLWLYLTPVVYPVAEEGSASILNWLNPVSPLLIASRDWMLTGQMPHGVGFLAVSFTSVLLLAGGLLASRVAMPVVIERLGA